MTKLRLTNEEKETILEKIKENWLTNTRMQNKDIKIEEIKKEIDDITIKNAIKPIIYITSDAYVKMVELIMQYDKEISWHGLVMRDKELGLYYLYDILVFPQINTATTTTTDEEEFAEWQTKLITDMEFPIENLRLHGHSHVNMQVFSSGTDDAYQMDMVQKIEDGDYYIFLIMNKRLEICAFVYDFDQQILFEPKDIAIDILGYKDVPLKKWAKNQIKENCKAQTVFGHRCTSIDGSFTNYDMGYYDSYFEDDIYEKPHTKKNNKKKGKKNGLK